MHTCGHFIRMILKAIPALAERVADPSPISWWKAPQRESDRVREGLVQGGGGVSI